MEIIISIRESLQGKDESDEGAGSGAFSSNSLYSCCALEKLAALVPPPRTHLIRYHGVLAPATADRDRIVPGPSQLTAAGDAVHAGGDATGDTAARRHRVEWAKLLARVFQVDVTCCPACGGPMKIIAAITSPPSIRKVLEALGLPSRSPPVAPARFQQLQLDAA